MMEKIRFAIVGLLVVFLFVFTSSAQAKARIFTGGKFADTLLKSHQKELEMVAGEPLDIAFSSAAFSFRVLADGISIGVVQSRPADELFKRSKEAEVRGLKVEDFNSVAFTDSIVKIAVHPDNPVRKLTDSQIADILMGKITNWKQIDGPDLPLKLVFPKSANFTQPMVYERYTKDKKAPSPQQVVDVFGVLRLMKAEKGTLSFFTASESFEGVSPAYIDTDIRRPSYFIVKKNGPVAGRKLFEHFQTHKLDPQKAW